jgi:transcriptional regulator with XRE-family HTH domain
VARKANDRDAYIGLKLKARRLVRNLTQEQLAEKLSITFQQIQKYEKGTNRVSASRLFEVAEVLAVPLNYFFDESYNDFGKFMLAEDNKESKYDPDILSVYKFYNTGIGLRLYEIFHSISDEKMQWELLNSLKIELERLKIQKNT